MSARRPPLSVHRSAWHPDGDVAEFDAPFLALQNDRAWRCLVAVKRATGNSRYGLIGDHRRAIDHDGDTPPHECNIYALPDFGSERGVNGRYQKVHHSTGPPLDWPLTIRGVTKTHPIAATREDSARTTEVFSDIAFWKSKL